jgi:hypothetical protein
VLLLLLLLLPLRLLLENGNADGTDNYLYKGVPAQKISTGQRREVPTAVQIPAAERRLPHRRIPAAKH